MINDKLYLHVRIFSLQANQEHNKNKHRNKMLKIIKLNSDVNQIYKMHDEIVLLYIRIQTLKVNGDPFTLMKGVRPIRY